MGLVWMCRVMGFPSPPATPATAPADTAAVARYLRLGQLSQPDQPDSAAWYYHQADVLSCRIGYPEGSITALLEAGRLLRTQGKPDTVLAMYNRAIGYARQHRLATLLGMAYINLGGAYLTKADYQQALSYALKGKALHEGRGDTLHAVEADRLLSAVYISLKQYQKSLFHAEQVLRVARKHGDQRLLFAALNNKGSALLNLNRFVEAQRFFEEAYPVARSLGDTYFLVICLTNMGSIQMYLHNADRMLAHYREALALAQRSHYQEGMAAAYFGISAGYFMRKEFTVAKRYLAEARRIGEAHQLQHKLLYVYKLQSALELLDGNMAAFKKMDGQRDSVERLLINESVLRNTQELEVKYQSRQQQARIIRLNQEKQIQTLSLRQKTLLNYVFLGAIGSLLGLGYLFYRNAVSKQIIAGHTHQLQARRIRELEQERQLIAADAILKGEEQERSRLARDLHDGLGGMLSGIKLSLTHMAGNMTMSEANALSFTRALTQLDHSIGELRRVAHSMMPENLVRFGLCEVLRDYCDTLEKSARLPIRFQAFGLEERLEQSTEIILYRIVQELLNNVVRHAGATQVLVQIMHTAEHLTLTVEDNGRGFDPQSTGKGIGLSNVLSRVNYLNGHTDIVSSPRTGTSVNIQIALCPVTHEKQEITSD
jgi:signal transduction histidine kinase